MEPKGGQASRLPPLPIQAWQGRQDACRSHDSALLRSPGSQFASPRRPQSGTAILAVTVTGHRQEACATFQPRRQMGVPPPPKHRHRKTSQSELK